MSIVSGSFSVTCSKCGANHDFGADDADFDGNGSDERGMGVENQYTWETTFDCECGNQIEIVYDVWEYPVGAYNHSNIEVTGGVAVGEFDYDFSDAPEPDEFDE